MRYLLEGEWTGYTSSQRRVVHREIIRDKRRVERLRDLRVIVYTDGTSLLLSLREMRRGEKANEIHGYRALVREAEMRGGSRVHVADLCPAAEGGAP